MTCGRVPENLPSRMGADRMTGSVAVLASASGHGWRSEADPISTRVRPNKRFSGVRGRSPAALLLLCALGSCSDLNTPTNKTSSFNGVRMTDTLYHNVCYAYGSVGLSCVHLDTAEWVRSPR